MKLLKNSILALSLLTGTLSAQNLVGLNINDTDLELQGSFIMNNAFGMSNDAAYVANVNYLHGEENDLFTAGLGVYQSYGDVDGLLFGLGLETVFADDFVSIPFFIHAMYVLPFVQYFPKTSVSGKVLYAPSVLTFSEGESYLEYRAEIDFDIISNMSIYGGYRSIEAEYSSAISNEYKDHDSFYGGLKYSF